jgi:hypothetical protein
MRIRRLPRCLRGVVRNVALAIDIAERPERKSLGRIEGVGLPLWVDCAEEEESIAEDWTAHSRTDVVQL